MDPFIFLVVTLPLCVSAAIPPRYLAFYAASLAMLALLYALKPAVSDQSSSLASTDFALLALVLLACALGVAARLIGAVIRRLVKGLSLAPRELLWPERPSATLSVGLGALAGLCTVAILAAIAQDIRPAKWAYAVVAGDAIGILVFASVVARGAGEHRVVRLFLYGLGGSAPVFCVALAGWAWSFPSAVSERAEVIAAGKPYCIQVAAAGDGYAEAISLADLTPLTMRARCREGWCRQNHAILLIDNGADPPSLLNWSYRNRDFRSDPPSPVKPPVRCRPKLHFTPGLATF